MANRMTLLVALTAMGCVTAHAQDETSKPDAGDWYKTEYAPLYADKPWDKAAEVAEHFAETIQIHNETTETVNALQWVSAAMQEWKIDGWIRSEIADIEIDQLNSTTTSFKTRWRDYYSGGNISYVCTWYLADYADGAWKITDFGDITCTEHGL